MKYSEWIELIKKNETNFTKVFGAKNKDKDSKDYKEAIKKIVYAVRKKCGYNDRDDSFVLNIAFSKWQYYKGVKSV